MRRTSDKRDVILHCHVKTKYRACTFFVKKLLWVKIVTTIPDLPYILNVVCWQRSVALCDNFLSTSSIDFVFMSFSNADVRLFSKTGMSHRSRLLPVGSLPLLHHFHSVLHFASFSLLSLIHFRQCPAIYTDYSVSNCTISNQKDLNRSSDFLIINSTIWI